MHFSYSVLSLLEIYERNIHNGFSSGSLKCNQLDWSTGGRQGNESILFIYLFEFMNSGKALEELQASLFNRFRSPDGAKRQEQRLCGPIASLTFNFVVAVSIIFMNKWVCIELNFLIALSVSKWGGFLLRTESYPFFFFNIFRYLKILGSNSPFFSVLFTMQ